MSATPRRVENLHTDKGKVPVYATGIVEQPWDDYSADDHATWATLYARQRKVLPGRASDEFLAAQDAMGMTPDRIPKFSELNEVLREATGWTLMGVEGLLRSEEHTSELQSLMRISYAVFCLNKKI